LKIRRALIYVAIAAMIPSMAFAANLREQVCQASAKFKDMTASIVPERVNRDVLLKMGKSFARSYDFRKATVTFKDPDMLKMDGVVGLVRIQYIVHGEDRIVRIPSIHYSKREDLSDTPGKAQTCLDVGLVTDGLWSCYNIRQVGTEDTPDGEVLVLELARIGDGRRNEKIWVEAKTFRLLKREKYRNEGDIKARYIFRDHKLIDGVVWVPTRTELHDRNGTLAAISTVRDIKVNTGVRDSEFK